MLLQVDEVSRFYGAQKALNEVSFRVENAQVVGLLGPNGAGKSTLMKIICCYLPQTSGSVSVCGLDTQRQSLQVRRKIGYLSEHNPLYLDMYVREYLDFAGGIYMDAKMVARRREEVISLTGLGRESHKKAGQLSKGYRQRLGLAAALIHEPDVLVLDEPTSGLDPNQLEEIRALVREIGREKIVIFSTHIMQEVQAVCDRVLLLNRGQLVADAPTNELASRMNGNTPVRVEFDKGVDLSRLQAIEGVTEAVFLQENTYRLWSSPQVDLRPAVFAFAVNNGLSVLTLQREEMNLESVFHRLTQTEKPL
ncbi:MAG: ATP-binding cassette domain-containing protein [Bacteroides sp.]|nr:ATP-binding cassette domain-containing protein [Ruminococcus flavefaciens]MCM1555215.1 ATP-binding cassette domain-containing protein [Bacteroides sp.]